MLNYNIEERITKFKNTSIVTSQEIDEISYMNMDCKYSYLGYDINHPSNDIYKKVYEVFPVVMDSYTKLNQEFSRISRLDNDYITYSNVVTALVEYLLATASRTIAYETLRMNDNELTENTIQVISEGLCKNAPLNHNSEIQNNVNIINLKDDYVSFIVYGKYLKSKDIIPTYTAIFKINRPDGMYNNKMVINANLSSNIWNEVSYSISFRITLQDDIWISNQ